MRLCQFCRKPLIPKNRKGVDTRRFHPECWLKIQKGQSFHVEGDLKIGGPEQGDLSGI